MIKFLKMCQLHQLRHFSSLDKCFVSKKSKDGKTLSPGQITLIQGKRGQKHLFKKFLKRYFMPDDPLLKTAGVGLNEELLNFWVKNLKEELTIVAINPHTGQILGLAVNSILRPDTGKKMKEAAAKEIKDKQVFRVINFFADVTDKAKLFQRFDINIMMECESLATHPSVRNKGIGKYLVLQSRALAQSAGFPLIRMDCTSSYSSKIAKRLRMERLPSRQVVDYVDRDGVPWVTQNPAPPNHKLDIYFDRLCSDLCSKFPPPPPQKPVKKNRFWFF